MKVSIVFLHNRRHEALHKAVKAMETKTNILLCMAVLCGS